DFIDALLKEDVYPPLQDFRGYLQRWSGVQSVHALLQLGKQEIRAQYAHNVPNLEPLYQRLFPSGRKRYQALSKSNRTTTIRAATSFRGGSAFPVLVCDRSQDRNSRKVIAYNLITLLLNGNIREIALDEMLKRAGGERQALERSAPLGAFDLYEWLPAAQMRRIGIVITHTIRHEPTECVDEIEGVRIRTITDGVSLAYVNRALERTRLTAFLIPNHEPDVVRRRLRLGNQIELFKFESLDGLEGCIAFGRDALLLDSVWQPRRTQSDTPIIC
ncbi:MAG: hypothetical protein JNL42_03305, partial [Anaerolineae bacterium]|nr:hypothetical protein [Anaerolineae bacterium]